MDSIVGGVEDAVDIVIQNIVIGMCTGNRHSHRWNG